MSIVRTVAVLVILVAPALTSRAQTGNLRPVIGVLTQEFGDGRDYIPASYVKFVEAGGARVIPLQINRTAEYYEKTLRRLSGVLFPGGDVDVHTSGYGKAGKIVFDYAVKRNQQGDYFPLWGTCNGFEMLVYLSVNNYVFRNCDANDQPAPLHFLPDAKKSRLLGTLPTDVDSYLQRLNVTANFHSNCLSSENFTKFGVDKFFYSLSYDVDLDGVEFVSTIEAKDYPFYGTQFHPEKNAFEWTNLPHHGDIPHGSEAIRVSNYFGQFFVDESRKSRHRYANTAYLKDSIYNYQPEYTQNNSDFTQMYFF